MDEGDDDFLPSLPPPPKKSPIKQKPPTPAKSPKKAKKDVTPKKVQSNDTNNTTINTFNYNTTITDTNATTTTTTSAYTDNTTPQSKPKKGRGKAKGDQGGSKPKSDNSKKGGRKGKAKGDGAGEKGDEGIKGKKGSGNKRRASGEKVNTGEKRANRPIPYFKTIPGTEFLVDAFNFKNDACKHYFLTHFHSDHYTGITKGWHHGIIYCSPITSKLLKHKIGVNGEYIREIPLDEEVTVENAQVCFLDANHCPGAAMILFKINDSTILHTGDFRYDPKMQLYKTLKANKVDVLYLDNTFCNPKYTFPPQSFVVNGIADLVSKELQNGKPLILIGSYVIGKERVLMEVAKRCNQKIFVPQDKYDILSFLEIDMSIFTVYPGHTPIHCVRMNLINYPGLLNVYNSHKNGYSRVVGIMPTGWSASRNPINRKDYPNFSIITAAYSEHSSYTELVKCVEWLRPAKIVPTVDCNTPQKIKDILSHFKGKMDNSRNLNTLFPYFAPKSAISNNPPSFSSSPSPTSSSLSSPFSSQKTTLSKKVDDDFEMDDIDLALLRSLMDESGTPYECGCDSEPEVDEELMGGEEGEGDGAGWGDGDGKKNKKSKKAHTAETKESEKSEKKDEPNMIKITPKRTSSSLSSSSSSFVSFDDWEALSEMTSSPLNTTLPSSFSANKKDNNNNNYNNSNNNQSTPTTPSPKPSPSSSPFSTPPSTPFSPPSFSSPPTPTSFPSATSGPKLSNPNNPFSSVSPPTISGKKEKEKERERDDEVFDVHTVDEGFLEKQRLIEQEIMQSLQKKTNPTPSKFNIPPPPPTPDASNKARAKLQANKTPAKKGKIETSPAQPSISRFFQSKTFGPS